MNKLHLIILISLISLSQSLKITEVNSIPNEIFEGIIDGLTKKGSSGKCKKDLLNGQTEIIKIIKDLISDIKSGKNIITSIYSAIKKLSLISGMIKDCRILTFVNSCSSIITENGRKKIVERMYNNKDHLLKDMNDFIDSVSNQQFYKTGFLIGDGIKIILDFYVN